MRPLNALLLAGSAAFVASAPGRGQDLAAAIQEAKSAHALAQTALKSGKPREVERLVRDAVSVLAKTPGSDRSWDAFLQLWNLASTAGKAQLTAVERDAWREAVRYQATNATQRPWPIKARGFMAAAQARLEEFDSAIRAQREVVAAWEELGNDMEAELARIELGMTLTSIDKEKDGLALIEKAHAFFNKRHDQLDAQAARKDTTLFWVKQVLANALRDVGNRYDARVQVLQQQAQRGYEAADPDDARLDTLRWELATTLLDKGDLVPARALAEKSYQAHVKKYGENDLRTAWARGVLSGIYKNGGDFESALRLGAQNLALREAKLAHDHLDLQMNRMNYGHSLMLVKRFEEAIALFRKAVKAMTDRKLNDIAALNLSTIYDNLGTSLIEAGHGADEVLQCYRAALDLARGNPQRLAQTHGGLGIAYRRLDQLRKADSSFAKAIPVVIKYEGFRQPSSYSRHHALTLAGLRARAKLTARISGLLDLSDRLVQQCYTLPGRQSYEFAKMADRNAELVLSLASQTKSAAIFRDRAFTIVESLRGISFRTAHRAAVALKDPKVADLLHEARRSRLKLTTMVSQGVGSGADVLQQALERGRLGFQALQRAMAERGLPVTLATPRAIAAKLDAGAAAISYRRVRWTTIDAKERHRETTQDRLLAFVVNKSGKLSWKDLGPADDIARLAEAFYERILQGKERGSSLKTASTDDTRKKLVDRVLRPVLRLAGKARVLVVCVDDQLHKIPLDALAPSNFELRFENSFVDLLERKPATHAKPSLFCIGGLDFEKAAGATPKTADSGLRGGLSPPLANRDGGVDNAFADLPGSRAEIDKVAGLFREKHGKSVVQLHGKSATGDALWQHMQRARFIHLATHGYYIAPPNYDPEFQQEELSRDAAIRGFAPMTLCGLTLSGANLTREGKINGVITGEELAAMDLRGCRLAVLSACETYRGEIRRGHGVASLQAALHAAGARSVITARWRVPDLATAELMQAFYTQLWRRNQTPAAALRLAKEKLRSQSGMTMKDWAAWILTGDAGS